jgi:hypothetical protein
LTPEYIVETSANRRTRSARQHERAIFPGRADLPSALKLGFREPRAAHYLGCLADVRTLRTTHPSGYGGPCRCAS